MKLFNELAKMQGVDWSRTKNKIDHWSFGTFYNYKKFENKNQLCIKYEHSQLSKCHPQ